MAIEDQDEYVIRTRFKVEDRVPGLAGAARRLSMVDRLAGGVGRTLTRSLGLAFGGLAAGAGLGLLTRGVVGLNSEIENAETGLASLLASQTGLGINDALSVARQQVVGLRQDAAAGAGELTDYAQGFQQILAPSLAAGKGIDQIRELNRLGLAAGFALRGQEGLKFAPFDINQALTTGVGERTTPIVNLLLRSIGVTNDAFNDLSKADRFDTLLRAFGTMSEGAELMGQTWEAQAATFRDGVKDIARELTAPLFDRWTEQLETANEWMAANKDNMREMAQVWGPRLVAVWDSLLSNGDQIAGLGAIGAGGGLLARLGGGGLLAGLGGAGSAALGGVLLPVAAGFTAVRSAIRNVPGVLDDIKNSGTQFLGALGEMWDGLRRLGNNQLVQGFLQTAGQGLIKSATFFVDTATFVARGIGVLLNATADLGNIVVTWVAMFRSLARGDLAGAQAFAGVAQTLEAAALKRFTAGLGSLTTDRERQLFAPGTPEEGVAVNVTNIGTVNVEVKAERLDDPNRVASTFDAVMSRVLSNPLTAGPVIKPV